MSDIDEWKCPNDSDGDNNCHLCYRSGHCFEYVKWLESQIDIYKEKTPHTKDGKPIFVGSKVWRKFGSDGLEMMTVKSISGLLLDDDTEDGFTIITYRRACINTELYSSREALEFEDEKKPTVGLMGRPLCPKCGDEEGCHGGCSCGFMSANFGEIE